ncbi:MAG: formate dehydrogenase subunit beta [Desulfuromonadaceae bacterium]
MSYVTTASTTGLPLKRVSAMPLPDAGIKKATQLAILVDISSCTGCKACEAACISWHNLQPAISTPVELAKSGFSYQSSADLRANLFMRMDYQEVENESGLTWFITKQQCMHCSDPGCLKACTTPGAVIQYGNGVVDFDHEKCIGCRMCIVGCPFNIPRFDANDKPFKCNFCIDRVAAGITPACAKTCTTNALHFGSKDDMLATGTKIVSKLKERGLTEARLYNPPGVGGTSYIYVLPHGKKTEQYAGLPADPSISPMVSFWKSPLKYLGGMALLGTIFAALTHLLVIGPNNPHDDDVQDKEE